MDDIVSVLLSSIFNVFVQNPIIIIFLFIAFFTKHYFSRHARFVRKSKQIIKKLHSIESPGAKFQYLKKINPFVFEEVILTSLKLKNIRIKRNRIYTGDGGIDGQFFFNGDKYYIQAKRYNNYIDLQHVKEFEHKCRRDGVKGIFVHTGKTGKKTKANVSNNSNVFIVSGQKLLDLIDIENDSFQELLLSHAN